MREKIQKALFDWNKSVVKDLASDDVCRLPEYALQLSRIIAFPELDVRNEISKIDQIGLKIRKTLENFSQSRPTQIIERINDQLYRKEKFRPNRDDYYNPSNSFSQCSNKEKNWNPNHTVYSVHACSRISGF